MNQPTPCRCCTRQLRTDERGFCSECKVCLHCEKQPTVQALGLCESCASQPGVLDVYSRRPGWTVEWEMILREKTREVQAALRARRTRTRRLPRWDGVLLANRPGIAEDGGVPTAKEAS